MSEIPEDVLLAAERALEQYFDPNLTPRACRDAVKEMLDAIGYTLVPEDGVVMPREPTGAMLTAGSNAVIEAGGAKIWGSDMATAYRAMIAQARKGDS